MPGGRSFSRGVEIIGSRFCVASPPRSKPDKICAMAGRTFQYRLKCGEELWIDVEFPNVLEEIEARTQRGEFRPRKGPGLGSQSIHGARKPSAGPSAFLGSASWRYPRSLISETFLFADLADQLAIKVGGPTAAGEAQAFRRN